MDVYIDPISRASKDILHVAPVGLFAAILIKVPLSVGVYPATDRPGGGIVCVHVSYKYM